MKREITKATYKVKDAKGEVIEKTGMVSTILRSSGNGSKYNL